MSKFKHIINQIKHIFHVVDNEDKMTLKQWLIHLQQWLYVCPLFDPSPHIYTGRLGSKLKICLTCGKEIIEEIGDDEIEFDNRFSQLMEENFDLETGRIK